MEGAHEGTTEVFASPVLASFPVGASVEGMSVFTAVVSCAAALQIAFSPEQQCCTAADTAA